MPTQSGEPTGEELSAVQARTLPATVAVHGRVAERFASMLRRRFGPTPELPKEKSELDSFLFSERFARILLAIIALLVMVAGVCLALGFREAAKALGVAAFAVFTFLAAIGFASFIND